MDAWQSGRFVTYPGLPEWPGPPWSLLLPPGWQTLKGRSPAEVALLQWQSANLAILDALSVLPRERWRVVDYATLVKDPAEVFRRACGFMDLAPERRIEAELSGQGLPRSRYTLTPPAKDKWRRHADALQPVLDDTAATMRQLESLDNRL